MLKFNCMALFISWEDMTLYMCERYTNVLSKAINRINKSHNKSYTLHTGLTQKQLYGIFLTSR